MFFSVKASVVFGFAIWLHLFLYEGDDEGISFSFKLIGNKVEYTVSEKIKITFDVDQKKIVDWENAGKHYEVHVTDTSDKHFPQKRCRNTRQ